MKNCLVFIARLFAIGMFSGNYSIIFTGDAMKIQKYKPFIISIVVTLLLAGIGGIITKNGMPAYELIEKPALTPPSILFPIVWTILYILMAIGAAIIWKSGSPKRDNAICLYVIQLVFNVLWSFFFFGLQAYLFSFIWIVILWLLIIAMIISFSKISRGAAIIQIPYLLWVSFAAYLNYSIWILNK